MERIDLFRELPPKTVGAEIGVYRGAFSERILETGVAHLHLIDCWQFQPGEYEKDPSNVNQGAQDTNHREVQQKFSKEIMQGRVMIHRKFSSDAANDFEPGSLDWVYIDADHTYQGCFQDLIRWSAKVKRGGFIMGHDYVDNAYSRAMGFDVPSAVRRFCDDYDWRLVRLTNEEWPSYQLVRAF